MFLAFFALLSVLASFAAWHSNPMYSAGRTIRGLLIGLTMIAAMVLVIIAAVHVAMKQSQAVALTIMFSVVIVVTVAMIWGIMKLTTAKVAAVPASTPSIHFHRRKLGIWAKRWVIAMLACGALALVLPGATKGIAYALASILGLLGCVMLLAGYFAAKNQDRALTALFFQPWVHWQYSPDEWKAWSDVLASRLEAVPPKFVFRRDWYKIALVWLAIAAGVMLFGPGEWQWRALYALVILALLLTGAYFAKGDAQNTANALRKKMARATPEAYFGDEGLFYAGELTPWISVSDWLFDASVDETAPRNLVLQIQKIEPGVQSSGPVTQRVLLPANAEQDLARLQRELSTKCPKARIALF